MKKMESRIEKLERHKDFHVIGLMRIIIHYFHDVQALSFTISVT